MNLVAQTPALDRSAQNPSAGVANRGRVLTYNLSPQCRLTHSIAHHGHRHVVTCRMPFLSQSVRAETSP